MSSQAPEAPSILNPILDPAMVDEEALGTLETDLRLATHLRALSRVAIATSHDIRTPLHTVILYLELLRNALADTADAAKRASQERYVEVIASEMNRLEGMLEMLFNQTRVAEERTDRYDLVPMVRDLHAFLEPHRRRTRVELTLTVPDDPVLVEGNRDALRHALVHILITVIEGTVAGEKVGVQVAVAEGRATIEIAGPGDALPPEILGGLAEDPRGQAALGGERGMYVARRVVERHGGSIHVRKGARSASILEIQLPLAAAENG